MIRLAVASDALPIYRLCERFHTASEYDLPIDQDYGMRYIKSHLQNENSLSLVLLDQDQIVGCLLAVCTPHLFVPAIVATELVWWVDPEFRGKASLELLKAFEYWSIEIRHCDILCVTSHMESAALERYYKIMKYTPKETAWYKHNRKVNQ